MNGFLYVKLIASFYISFSSVNSLNFVRENVRHYLLEHAKIIQDILSYLNLKCVYLIHSAESGINVNAGFVLLQKILSALNIQAAAPSLDDKDNCRSTRPLYVLRSSNRSMRDSIMKSLQSIPLSKASWLLFLENHEHLEELFADINIPFDCEFLIAQKEDSNFVLMEVYRVKATCPLQTYRIGYWSFEQGVVWPVDLHKKRNLQGLVFKTSVNNSLFVTVTSEKSNKPQDVGGFLGDVWHILESTMNFTSDYYYHHGEWRDVARMIHNGDVNVSITDILMKSQDVGFADYIAPLVNVRTYIVIRMPNKMELMRKSFLTPFSPLLWTAVIIVMHLSTLCLAIIFNIGCHYKNKRCLKTTYNYPNSLFHIFGTFCQQGHTTVQQSTPGRVVFVTSHLTAMLIFTCYSASLFSSLAARYPVLPFDTFQQFLDDGSYQLNVLRQSGQMDYFRVNKEDLLMQQIYKKMISPNEATLPSSILEGLHKVCRGRKQAYFATLHGVKLELRKLSCSPVIVPRAYVPGTISMSIEKHSPYQELFKYNIENMRRVGILQRLLNRDFSVHMPQNELTVQNVDLEVVRPIFVLLAVGFLVAVLLLVIERLQFCFTKPKKRNRELSFTGS